MPRRCGRRSPHSPSPCQQGQNDHPSTEPHICLTKKAQLWAWTAVRATPSGSDTLARNGGVRKERIDKSTCWSVPRGVMVLAAERDKCHDRGDRCGTQALRTRRSHGALPRLPSHAPPARRLPPPLPLPTEHLHMQLAGGLPGGHANGASRPASPFPRRTVHAPAIVLLGTFRSPRASASCLAMRNGSAAIRV